MISLAAVRYPGMPLFPGHPPFQVLNYRTPRGIRVTGAQPWGPVNDAGLGYMAEYVMATSHSGRPHGRARPHDRRRRHALVRRRQRRRAPHRLRPDPPRRVDDAARSSPAASCSTPPATAASTCLPKGSPIDAAELEAICAAEGVTVGPGDVVVIRTGYMGLWPDAEAMAAHKTPGPDISAARWLLERGVVATGTDTETYEVQPAPDPGPDGQPPAGPHAAAHPERHLPHGEPGPRGARPPARLRVPVRRPARSRSAAPPGRWSTPWPSSEGGPPCPPPWRRSSSSSRTGSRSRRSRSRSPGPNEVLARVRAVSICGTDAHLIRGDYPGFWPPAFPFIPGHEWAGEIVALGPGAERYGWKVGDRVAGTSHDACGVCQKCVEGRYNLCENYGRPGLHKQYGHSVQGADADVRRPGREDDLPAARPASPSTRAPSSTRPRSPSTSPTGATSRPGDTVAITGRRRDRAPRRRRGPDPRRRRG